MAAVSVTSAQVSSGRVTLIANDVLTVTFANNIGSVQVYGDGTSAVYFTVDGSTPTVDGRNTYELPAGTPAVDQRDTVNSAGGDVVKLISAGAPVVRVQQA